MKMLTRIRRKTMQYLFHSRVMLKLLFLTANVAFVDAWTSDNGPPPVSRRDVLRIPAATLVGAATFSAFGQGANADATEDASTSTPTKLPFSGSNKKTGVLWKTVWKEAAPATPDVMNKIMNEEIFGDGDPLSSSKGKQTTGIVCISERHDDFQHHIVQLHIIQSIRKALDQRSSSFDRAGVASKTFAIGVECFQRKDQPFLDKFIASGPCTSGSQYTLSDLKRDTSWDTNWGYDMLHYAPILLNAQAHNLRILGLHPSQELVDTVSRKGLDGLPDSVIRDVDTTEAVHWERFRTDTREATLAPGTDDSIIEAHIRRLYEVQCFREEYMAEMVAQHMAKQPCGWVAILAGERHILGRDGIPDRALRRISARRTEMATARTAREQHRVLTAENLDNAVSNRGVFTFVPQSVSFPVRIAKDVPDIRSADYVWYTQRDPALAFDTSVVNSVPRELHLTQAPTT